MYKWPFDGITFKSKKESLLLGLPKPFPSNLFVYFTQNKQWDAGLYYYLIINLTP
jgi:hypothetical protein